MFEDAVAELAPSGRLRVGINTANFLLVTGKDASGQPQGVAPDFALAIAERLGVPVTYVPFASAGQAGDGVSSGLCDIALIGAEPARAEKLAFTPAYAEIEATYLVPAGSELNTIAEIDRAGVRISVCGGSAYDLWLARHIKHADLVRSATIAASNQRFLDEGLDALAGLRTGLIDVAGRLRGTRILDGYFTLVQQAVGTSRGNHAGAAFLSAFVAEAKETGFVADLIAKYRVIGLSVARG